MPHAMRGFPRLAEVLLRGPSTLSQGKQEMIAARNEPGADGAARPRHEDSHCVLPTGMGYYLYDPYRRECD
jgi:hypothetical protein